MSLERKIDYWMDRIVLQWKSMGKYKYVSFLYFYCILPITICFLKRIDPGGYLDYFEQLIMFFIPLFATWWISLVMQEYVEGDGRELLHIGNDGRLWDVIIFSLIYLISLFPLFIYVENIMPRAIIVIPIILAKSLLFVGISYFFCVLSSNVAVGIIINVTLGLFLEGRLGTVLGYMGLENYISVLGYMSLGLCLLLCGKIIENKIGNCI